MVKLNYKQMWRLMNILQNTDRKFNSVIFKDNGAIEIDWETKIKMKQIAKKK